MSLAKSHHVTSSLAERSNPNTKANQTQRTQQTKHRGAPANRTQSADVFIKKKKKKKSPIYKPKPNPVTHGRSRRHRCRHSSLIVIVIARLVALHRKLEIGERRLLCLYSDAWCSLWPSLKVFRSFSL